MKKLVLVLTIISQSALAADGLIVGGSPAPVGAYPFTVAVLNYNADGTGGAFCAGTLIDDRHVLTAAHCVNGTPPERIKIDFFADGVLRIPTANQIQATKVTVHPQYRSGALDTVDLAMLEIPTSPSDAQPVELLTSTDANLIAPGTNGIAIGWGMTDAAGKSGFAAKLMHTLLPIRGPSGCWMFGAPNFMICATSDNYSSAPRGSCFGDSGGPFVVRAPDGKLRLAGVTSYVKRSVWNPNPCGDQSIYVKVPSFSSWISAVTQ
jgi:secreted trypsin-like serine protease